MKLQTTTTAGELREPGRRSDALSSHQAPRPLVTNPVGYQPREHARIEATVTLGGRPGGSFQLAVPPTLVELLCADAPQRALFLWLTGDTDVSLEVDPPMRYWL